MKNKSASLSSLLPTPDYIEGELLTRPPDAPAIAPKAGWKTSQGQMTAIFIVVAMTFSYFGYSSWTVERLQNIYDAVLLIITTVGPLIMAGYNLIRYTDSRGKIQSNAIMATAEIIKAAEQPLQAVQETIVDQTTQVIKDQVGEVVGVFDKVQGIFHQVKK